MCQEDRSLLLTWEHDMVCKNVGTSYTRDKGTERPSAAITTSQADGPPKSVPEYISSAPTALRLFADGSEMVLHQPKFENSAFSGERKKMFFCHLAWRPNNGMIGFLSLGSDQQTLWEKRCLVVASIPKEEKKFIFTVDTFPLSGETFHPLISCCDLISFLLN